MKKTIALFAALAMIVSLFAACQLTDTPAASPADTSAPQASAEPAESDATSPDAATPAEGTDGELDLDLTAIVATIGSSETLTLGEVKDVYDAYLEYFAYYGYDIASDATSLATFQDDLVDMLVQQKLISVKADSLGYSDFSSEQQTEFDSRVDATLKELDDYYREQAMTEAENDDTIDVDARTMELILQEAAQNMSKEDATYEEYSAYLANEKKLEYLTEIMKEDLVGDVAADEESITNEYTSRVTSDTTTYTDAPDTYKVNEETYESTLEGAPVLYVPDGYSRVKDLFISYEGELPEQYTTNKSTMTSLKSEYNSLAFDNALEPNADSAKRMEEIVAEYKTLQADNDALFTAYAKPSLDRINAIYTELEGGADFDALMSENTESENFTSFTNFMEKGMLISNDYTSDNDWSSEIKAAFADLEAGAYSAPFSDSYGYHIIKYVGDETPGVKKMDEVHDAIAASLTDEMQSAEWQNLLDEWMADGSVTINTAVYRALSELTAE